LTLHGHQRAGGAQPLWLEPLRDVTLIAMGDTRVRFQILTSGAIVRLGDILGDVLSDRLSTTTKNLKEQFDQVHRMLRATGRR
jgi:hypothetical protein